VVKRNGNGYSLCLIFHLFRFYDKQEIWKLSNVNNGGKAAKVDNFLKQFFGLEKRKSLIIFEFEAIVDWNRYVNHFNLVDDVRESGR